MSNFANQAEIDKIEAKIKEIDPSLKFRQWSLEWGTDIAIEAYVSFPLKGNQNLIEALEKIGFTKRSKRLIDNSAWWERSNGYYVLDMSIPVPH